MLSSCSFICVMGRVLLSTYIFVMVVMYVIIGCNRS